MSTAGESFRLGVRRELPIIVGVVPFGLIYGLLASDAGIPAVAAFAMSSIVFAGAAQFVSIELIGSSSPIAVIWVTTLVINSRHFLYSAALSPHAQRLDWPMKSLLAYLLTDEAYAPTALRYQERSDHSTTHFFWLGAGLTLWGSWQLSTAFGVFFGAQLPTSLGFDFTLPLTFIGMVAPALHERPMIVAGLSAGGVAVASSGLPYQLGLLAATAAGITSGMVAEKSWGRCD